MLSHATSTPIHASGYHYATTFSFVHVGIPILAALRSYKLALFAVCTRQYNRMRYKLSECLSHTLIERRIRQTIDPTECMQNEQESRAAARKPRDAASVLFR